jgi:phosphoglycerate dehydrogenase-like enzyme
MPPSTALRLQMQLRALGSHHHARAATTGAAAPPRRHCWAAHAAAGHHHDSHVDTHVVAVICSSGGPVLDAMPNDLDGVSFIVGNSMADFEADPRIDSVSSIMFVAAGGDASVLTPLFDRCQATVQWCHSLFAGVDALAPFIADRLAMRPDIPLTNGKGAFSSSLAEYVMSSMLYFSKKIQTCQHNRENMIWDKFVMPELKGKTVGFVGFGHIGQATAKLAQAFGMHVLALRRDTSKSGGQSQADEVLGPDQKLDLFARSDFVVSVLPGTPETVDFCGAPEFAEMKESAIFISCGRGVVVDEEALASALESRSIAGAALDVFKAEPLSKTSRLWGCENLLLTAHNADYTADCAFLSRVLVQTVCIRSTLPPLPLTTMPGDASRSIAVQISSWAGTSGARTYRPSSTALSS